MAMIQVCPKCLQPKVMGHVCEGPKVAPPVKTATKPSTVKQAAITVQAANRHKYTHENVELERITLFVSFDIDVAAGAFDAKWLLDFIKSRMDIPEGPEDYPNVEDFYIKDARLG